MFDRRKLLKSNKLTIAIILLAVVLTLIPIAYSKLFSKTDSDSKIETALYVLLIVRFSILIYYICAD